MYNIKEIYYTLQGEGFYTGRPAIFIRFSGCNLWNGLEADRNKAICDWCDTNFFGINGPNGGKHSAPRIKKIIIRLWPSKQPEKPYVVFTGGEPLLQLDNKLISAVHNIGFEIGIETNGTITPPKGIDWVCVSPKANTNLVVKAGNELKFVYPQCGLNPEKHEKLDFDHFFIQPMDGSSQNENIKKSKEFVAKNPKWKISLQTHKLLGIP